MYQDVPLGRPHGAERKVTFGTPVFFAIRSSALSGAPSGHPWGHSSYHAGRTHSRRFPTESSPQSLVKPSYIEDQASGQVYFYILAIFDPRQSHVCKVTFGTGRPKCRLEGPPPPPPCSLGPHSPHQPGQPSCPHHRKKSQGGKREGGNGCGLREGSSSAMGGEWGGTV